MGKPLRNRFLPLIVSLLATIVLFFVVDDFIHRVIVRSLLYASWFLTLLLGSIPQLVFWAAFIVSPWWSPVKLDPTQNQPAAGPDAHGTRSRARSYLVCITGEVRYTGVLQMALSARFKEIDLGCSVTRCWSEPSVKPGADREYVAVAATCDRGVFRGFLVNAFPHPAPSSP
jgi:hypothetical protein